MSLKSAVGFYRRRFLVRKSKKARLESEKLSGFYPWLFFSVKKMTAFYASSVALFFCDGEGEDFFQLKINFDLVYAKNLSPYLLL